MSSPTIPELLEALRSTRTPDGRVNLWEAERAYARATETADLPTVERLHSFCCTLSNAILKGEVRIDVS